MQALQLGAVDLVAGFAPDALQLAALLTVQHSAVQADFNAVAGLRLAKHLPTQGSKTFLQVLLCASEAVAHAPKTTTPISRNQEVHA